MANNLLISGLPTAFFVWLLIYFLRNPDKFEHWVALFDQALYNIGEIVPAIRERVDKRAVASSIQDSVNGVSESINKRAPDAFPHALRVEWVEEETRESFINKGQVVVRLKHFVNQDKNIVDATMLYIKSGFLPRAKHYLDSSLCRGCELKMAAYMFDSRRETGAYDYFLTNELEPALRSEDNLRADLQLLEEIESAGYFDYVFLVEVKQIGEKLLGGIPTPHVQQELRAFANFLRTIATKGKSEEVPLSFKGSKLKAALVLVAKKEKIFTYGITPYVRRVEKLSREGYDSIYLAAWGEELIKYILEIKNVVQDKSVKVLRRYEYHLGGDLKAALIVCQSNLTYLAKQKSLQEEVRKVMVEVIPEVASGEIEIVSIARIKGAGCKIAVRYASPDNEFSAVGPCIGTNSDRLSALRSQLNKEFVGIVGWSPDIKAFLVNALVPLKIHHVETIEINEENLVATMTVNSDEAYKVALGKYNNDNLNLAMELTGWVINIRGPKRSAIKITPEDELRVILLKAIPEIKNNEIQIVKIARQRGVGSKVLVRWTNDSHAKGMATQRCYGVNHELVQKLQRDLPGEWINFHEWSDDEKKLLIRCLYPLKEAQVLGVDFDLETETAILSLDHSTQYSQAWKSHHNLFLAEKITGWKIETR